MAPYSASSSAVTPASPASTGSAERIPPQALDVERTVLGSMLIDEQAASAVFEMLDETAFYSGANRRIFECMKELFAQHTPIDIITLAEALRKKQWLEAVGEEPYLAELAESIATSANIEYYGKILREKGTLRELISTAAQITTECFSPDVEPQVLLDKAEARIFGVSDARMKKGFAKVGDLIPRTMEEMDEYAKGNFKGVKTGFTELDEITTGLQKSDLIIIAGRPSMGKTSFCLSIAANVAIRGNRPTALFSLEMSKGQLAQRLLCAEARVRMQLFRLGKLSNAEMRTLANAGAPLYQAPLYIDDTAGISVLELRAKARRLKAQRGLDLIIIDYLQLMGSSGKVESRQQEISQISRSLKGVAKELDVPLIVLSQLSRQPEQRTEHRPQLSDLRESGAIEQDADIVMFVYRDAVYNRDIPEAEKGRSEIIIGKQRNGPIGMVNLSFIEDYARFENYTGQPDGSGGF